LSSTELFSHGIVSGVLHKPEDSRESLGGGLILTHGAGSNRDAPVLVALASALAKIGIYVLRCDLPFRQKRRSGPPYPAGASEDRKGLREAVDQMRTVVSGKILLGGHSYGGRQASILAAEDPGLVAGLLLLSYPLHPPKKPSEMRTGHFAALKTPCLFVHGAEDPFGSMTEMRSALSLIPVRKELLEIRGAGHELTRGERADLGTLIAGSFSDFFDF
jgi:uncharacterized protein